MAQHSHAVPTMQEFDRLKARLSEAEDTLEAIRLGAVDALVVHNHDVQQIYTLKSADYTYRMLIESMDQAALTISEDGIILYSNKQLSTMLGVPLGQIIGAKIQSFVTPEDISVMQDILDTGRLRKISMELRLRPAQQQSLGVLISVTPMVSEETGPNLCMVITDMTDRNRVQEIKDEFISLASHQLRTPATGVKQYIHMVLDGYFGELNEAQTQALLKANESNERELQVINDLLKVAQIDAGEVNPNKYKINLFPIVESIISEQIVRSKERNQTITLLPTNRTVKIIADPVLIRMAVENVVDNASKYTPDGKNIRVAVKINQDKVLVTVEDEGVGISQDDISKLFKKFSRIPNSLSVKVGGSGLGLYWVKKVIDLHQGEISVATNRSGGTLFKISLPAGL